MQLFKEAWIVYWKNKKHILLIALLLLLPLSVFNFVLTFYFQYYFTFLFLPIAGDFMQSLFNLIFLSLMEIPFIHLVLAVMRNEDISFGRIMFRFFELVVPVYFLACVYALGVSVGIVFLLLPGIFLLIFFALFPHALIMEEERGFGSFKRSFTIVKQYFFQVVSMLFLLFIFEVIMKLIFMGSAIFMSDTYIPAMLINLLLYLMIFPFLSILFSICYADWAGIRDDWEYESQYV